MVGSALLYPATIVTGALLYFAPALLARRLTLPLDILGIFYPWSEQATELFPAGEPQNALIQDVLTLTTPWFVFAWHEIRAGRLPLWNPFQLGGMPFIANDESAFFFPLQLVGLLMPLAVGLQFLMLAETTGVGIGMYAYLRAIGLRRPAATLGGLGLMLSGFFVVWIAYPQAATAMWLPWLLLCCEKLLQGRARRMRWIAALAVAQGVCLFGGHIQTAAHVVGAAVVYCVCRLAGQLWGSRCNQTARRRVIERGACVAAGLMLGVAVAAVQLLPTAQYLAASYTLAQRSASRAEPPQPLSNLAAWLVPNISGNPAYTGVFISQRALNDSYFNYTERTAYVGIAMLVLAGVGLSHPRRRFRHFRLIFVLLAGLAGALAYGIPPVYPLVVRLPILHNINHNRVIFVVAFCLVALGAIGFDALVARACEPAMRAGRRLDAPRLAGYAAVLVMGLLMVTVVALSKEQIAQLIDAIGGAPSGPGSSSAWIRAWTSWAFVLFLLSVGLIGATLTRKLEPRLGALAIALLAVSDVLLVAVHYYPRSSPAQLFPPVATTQALQALGPTARFVTGQDDWHVHTPDLMPNASTVYRVRDLNAYEAVVALRGHNFMDAVNQFGPNRGTATVLVANYAPDYDLLALAGVTHVLLPTDVAEPPGQASHLVYQRESDAFDLPQPPLRRGERMAQAVIAPTDDLSAVGFFIVKDATADGKLVFTLESPDTGALVHQTLSLVDQPPRGWLVASFPPLHTSAGRHFVVSLTLDPATPATGSVQLLADPGQAQPGWERTAAGAPASGTFRVRLYRSTASAGVVPAWADASHTIFALAGPRPRAYVASSVIAVSDAATALDALPQLHVPGTDALVEQDGVTSAGGTAEILDDQPGDITIKSSTPAAGFLVLSEGFADGGWRAEIDGASQPVLRANYLFQGVRVPAGEHTVRFHYWPLSVTVGLVVSGAALAAVMLLLVWPWLRGQRARAETTSSKAAR